MEILTKSYPLNDTNYLAEDLRKWNYVRTSGVVSVEDNLAVIANNDMSVTIKKGLAFLNDGNGGVAAWIQEDVTLSIDIASGIYNRIDAIALHWDIQSNKIMLKVVKGMDSTASLTPTVTRNNAVYEIFLAYIHVNKGITTITQGLVTDTRLDTSVCGLVRDGIERIPTEQLQKQAEELLERLNKAVEDVGSLTIPDGSVTTNKIADSTITKDKIAKDVLLMMYPIGIIVEFNSSINPNTVIGGTWQRFGDGKVTVGLDTNQTEFNTLNKMGGEKTHTLTIEEMPPHTHSIYHRNYWVQPSIPQQDTAANSNEGKTQSGSTGGGKPHNNLQPYIVVYRWVRTG